MWCVASRPPRSSVVGFLERDHPGSALGGLSAHDEHTSASSGESSASGQESMVVPPASRTSGAAASPKCSTSSVTPLASTVVMRPAPLRRSRSRRALRTEPRSVSSCRAFPRVHPLRATAEFVYGVHNHQARIRLACGFHDGGLVGAVGGTVYGGARSRNGDGSHRNSSLLSQRSRSVLRERWLRCSDTVRGFRPGHVPLWVPDIEARFPLLCSSRKRMPTLENANLSRRSVYEVLRKPLLRTSPSRRSRKFACIGFSEVRQRKSENSLKFIADFSEIHRRFIVG